MASIQTPKGLDQSMVVLIGDLPCDRSPKLIVVSFISNSMAIRADVR
jgi:hypothetical protein